MRQMERWSALLTVAEKPGVIASHLGGHPDAIERAWDQVLLARRMIQRLM